MKHLYSFGPSGLYRRIAQLACCILLLLINSASAQTQTFSGVVNVGVAETYKNLTGDSGLFKALNAGQLGGNLAVNITSDLVEDGSNRLNQLSETGTGGYSITIRSDGQVRTISPDSTMTGQIMINIKGADRVTFDGGTGRKLIFTNSTPFGSNIIFNFDKSAVNDTIKNCIIRSDLNSAYSGTINVEDSGMNQIVIMNSDISSPLTGTDTYTIAIYSSSQDNRISVLNNNISNFEERGVYLMGSDSSVIVGNSFYWNMSYAADELQHAISIQGGHGHRIIGNYIGGSQPMAGGSPWENDGLNSFHGIYLSSADTTTPSSIQGNVISNILLSNPSVQTLYPIDVVSAHVLIGTDSGNIVGHPTQPNSIVVMGTGTVQPIYTSHANSVIENNIVANITQTSTVPDDFFGIYAWGINEIRINKNMVYNCGPTSASTGTSPVAGIYLWGGNGNTRPNVVTNNMISLGDTVSNNHPYIGIDNSGFPNNPMIMYNNTVALWGTNTGSSSTYAYLSRSSTKDVVLNNIFHNMRFGGSGRHYAIGRRNTTGGSFNSNYNLLKNTDSTMLAEWGTGNGVDFAQWKTSSHSDTNSVNTTVSFMSRANLHIDSTHSNSWNVNGQGMALADVPDDIDGDSRSTVAGVPTDIGADEMRPYVPVIYLRPSSNPATGSTTSYSSGARKVVEFSWGTAGTVPSAVNVQYYSGVLPPAFSGKTMYSYYDVTSTGGVGYTYSIKYYYTDAEKNNIADANLRMIKQDGSGTWTVVGGTNGVDANGKYVAVNNLTGLGRFSLADASALPVKMTTLIVTSQQAGNVLQWQTQTEINNTGFEIQRSANGVDFIKVGFAGSKAENGNSTNRINYEYFDERSPVKTAYYRLMQIDKDGRFSYSNVAVARKGEITATQLVNVYPNPAKEYVRLSIIAATNERVQLTITDNAGKNIKLISAELVKGDNTLTIPVTRLHQGQYYIRLTCTAGCNETRKFIKE